MKIFRFLMSFISVPVAALAGNWVGGEFRRIVTGQRIAAIHYIHTTEGGMRMDNYPVNTKFIPALMFGSLGKPRWLFAFLGGVLASLYVDDEYEAVFLERVIVPLVVNPVLEKRQSKSSNSSRS